MLFIGIDLGGSFIKGAVLNTDTLCLKHIDRTVFPGFLNSVHYPHREVAPEEIVESVRELIEQLLSRAPNCAGIVMCGQMHGIVLASEKGEPLSNFISWQDQRTLMPHPSGAGTYFDVLARRITPAERRQLGNELRPSLPLSVLFWLAEENRLPEVESIPVSLADFVIANLCGSLPTTEATNAAACGAFNLISHDWDYDVLSKLGQEQLRWPALRSLGEVVGFFKVGSKLIPCYMPVGDQQCTLLGISLGNKELSLNIATGSQVSMISPRLEFGNYQTRPFFDGKFLKTITHIPAGRALNALVRLLTGLTGMQHPNPADLWADIEKCAMQVVETDLRVNLAFFTSACGDHGEITNMREENMTAGHLFRAAFENMADNYFQCASRLSAEEAWTNLVFSGGLAQKLKVLRQIVQQKFRLDYRLCASEEDALLGLLVLAQFCGQTASSVTKAAENMSQKKKVTRFGISNVY
jgi:sugar (pentulose or hexulose) kinase